MDGRHEGGHDEKGSIENRDSRTGGAMPESTSYFCTISIQKSCMRSAPLQRIRDDPGNTGQDDVQRVLGPYELRGVTAEQRRQMHQRRERRIHDGEEDRGEAGPYAG